MYTYLIPSAYVVTYILMTLMLHGLFLFAFPAYRDNKGFAVAVVLLLLIGVLPPVLGAFLPDSAFKFFMMRIGNVILGFLFYLILLELAAWLLLLLIFLFGSGKREALMAAARVLLAVVCLGTILVNAYGLVHAQDVKVHSLDVTIDKELKADLGDRPLKVVLLGDLHMSVNSHPETMQKMVDLVNAQDADLVLTAGDFLTSTYYGLREPEVYQEILKGIKARYGSYGVYGNHDVEEPLFGGFPMTAVEDAVRSKEVTDFICGCGMEVLSDEVVKVVDDSIVLVLREDGEKSGRGTEERLTASELMKGIDTSLPVLVLEHEPVDYKNLKANGADLALSGHTHAGQMFPATLFTSFFNENNYGFKVVDDLQTVVTSGVGYYGPPLRVGCDSEIMVVNVYFKK
ncbi:MAG: metallophosphoesterase [Lachnospiraceae bacterium]|nr:metallophosphoesterase [Lachnospiraceae bacterium]